MRDPVLCQHCASAALLAAALIVLVSLSVSPAPGNAPHPDHLRPRHLPPRRAGEVRPTAGAAPASLPSPPRARLPSAAVGGRFACEHAVCVALPHPTVASLPTYDDFPSCVAACVASSLPRSLPPRRTRAATPPSRAASSSSAVSVGNASLDAPLEAWLEARHTARCGWATPVYFAGVSPNGVGNKLLAMVMAFHMALMTGRQLVITDWPPTTLKTSYPLGQVVKPSSCQALFDSDKARPPVKKCSIIACPTRTVSSFANGRTQPHWAHLSETFLELPPEWSHLEWIHWWRAITQYLVQPGPKLLAGMAATLRRVTLFASSGDSARYLRRASPSETEKAAPLGGFAPRVAAGVASWTEIARPLIGVHVRVGDGCWDSKRGGCKYVKSFGGVLTRLREAGIHQGTIFLATDNSTIASEARLSSPSASNFNVLTLSIDRSALACSQWSGCKTAQDDELFHLQLLDIALLSQADLVAGVFGSTFVKTALQLGSTPAYLSLDSFPWCPLLRCFWGWKDMCHNCDICNNLGGSGEACTMGYHTPSGLRRVLAQGARSTARAAFRRFISSVELNFKCAPFALHPLGKSQFELPVVGTVYAPPLPSQPDGWPQRICHQPLGPPRALGSGGDSSDYGANCSCGFIRYADVDNSAAQRLKPAAGFGLAQVPLRSPSLHACEAACCHEELCHSVVWLANESRCVASLSMAHGARPTDWCWHPSVASHAVTSLRLPGAWEKRAVEVGEEVHFGLHRHCSA
ncbi:hypothetical protein AB1Y20_009240 [Prymnesium parvum]|uniref:Peptide-O-fucosyltransferase 1 n=1 Tax=Prymnesium parvum TaxID=97485 RepID=A0AB34JZT8_PRYPA